VCAGARLHARNHFEKPGELSQPHFPAMEILQQLGELFLEAVPTIIIVLLFYFFLRWSFFGPIQRAMAERDDKIEGARVEAAAAEAGAEKELDEYHEALRKARVEIFAQQEEARKVVLGERALLLRTMRARVQEEVAATKRRINADLAAARKEVEAQTPSLAGEIVRGILERRPPSPRGAMQ
jgi:F0F1-type ATP synthase membrane subunit b/b'